MYKYDGCESMIGWDETCIGVGLIGSEIEAQENRQGWLSFFFGCCSTKCTYQVDIYRVYVQHLPDERYGEGRIASLAFALKLTVLLHNNDFTIPRSNAATVLIFDIFLTTSIVAIL
jgi:hypothetical protein